MIRSKVLGLGLCAVAAFAQGPGGRGGAFARPGGPMGGGFGAERVVTGAPYSAVEVRQFEEKLGDGNTISRTSQIALYRDTRGRTRSEVTVTPPPSSGRQPYTMITISDPVAGQRHLLDSSTMTARISRMPMLSTAQGRNGRGNAHPRPIAPAGAAARSGRGGAAIARADLGTQLRNGVLATGTRETEVIAAGRIGNSQPIQIVRESWFSAELKRAVEVKVVDPQHGNSTMELTNLVAGEPSAAFFAVPAGYTENTATRGGRTGLRPR
jgi:hypothetical protein